MIQVLLAKEVDPPEGVESVEWLLLTALPVTNAQAAKQLVDGYTLRWRMDPFRDLLKTGGLNAGQPVESTIIPANDWASMHIK